MVLGLGVCVVICDGFGDVGADTGILRVRVDCYGGLECEGVLVWSAMGFVDRCGHGNEVVRGISDDCLQSW